MANKPPKVPFTWEGKNKNGKRVRGIIEASSQAMVRAELRRKGILPLKIKKKLVLFTAPKKPIVPRELSIFMRQLATMMEAGIPLVQSFEIIASGHDNPSMRELLINIKTDVEGGDNLSHALSKHPLLFDDLVCNLVEAGEQAGVLDTLLDKIATYKEKTESIKAKIKKALFYPVAVLIIAFIVSAILLIFVVPQFEELFSSFGADLPGFTQMIINLSEWMQEWWWAVLAGAWGLTKALGQAKRRSRAFNRGLDRLSLKLPVIGEILNKAAIARFARTLSTMFSAGVPLVEALQNVAGASGNIVYTEAILTIRDEVSTGMQLQVAMDNVGLFPNMVVQMIGIGEESGALDNMLSKVADFYEEEVDDAVDGLSSLLEPLIMAVLGVLVGSLIVAMYLPIFKMGSVI